MHCKRRLTLASSSSAIALKCEPATDTSSAAAKLGPIQAHTARVRSTSRSASPRHAYSGRGEGAILMLSPAAAPTTCPAACDCMDGEGRLAESQLAEEDTSWKMDLPRDTGPAEDEAEDEFEDGAATTTAAAAAATAMAPRRHTYRHTYRH